MADKVKKTKVQAKPKATTATTKPTTVTPKINATKKQTVAEKVIATTPSHHEIALLALHYWAERGRQHGQHEQDWLRAERELMKMAS